tara:strand:+ start:66 stop:536 length:471 start_codon:yes stop_codon:yes gene_type:complete
MSKERLDELKSSLAIDVNALDKECQQQPQLLTEAGEFLAEIKLKAKQAKMNYDEELSKAERQIRDNPDTFGISKITESAVKAAVVIHGDVHNAREKMLYTEYEAEKVNAIVDGFHHKRSMLDNEVKLYLAGFFGEVPVGYNNPQTETFNRRKAGND